MTLVARDRGISCSRDQDRLRRRSSTAGLVVYLFAALVSTMPLGAVPSREVESTTGILSVTTLSQLDISGSVSSLLSLAQDGAGEAAYDASFVESATSATVLTINTNDSWDLSAKLAGDWSCPGAYDKAENDLYVQITNSPTGTIQNSADSYINLSGTDTQILSHDSAVAGNEVDIQTKVLMDWTKDIPGDYSLTVTYTLVTHLP